MPHSHLIGAGAIPTRFEGDGAASYRNDMALLKLPPEATRAPYGHATLASGAADRA